MTQQRGFTLLELMIVIALIAIIAAIAIPNLLAARLNAHETAAIATLRSIATAQSQFQTSAKADLDRDGYGEFGFFRELSGAIGIRNSADGTVRAGVLSPPAVSGSFRVISATGTVNRSGYLFKTYLPDSAGQGLEESPNGAFSGNLDPDNCEIVYAIYAWPVTHNTSGSRTFFVNQGANMTWTDDSNYSGANFVASAAPGVAFQGAGSVANITGAVAIGTVARDGNRWAQVN